ncbi:MAG: thioredoxin domain-containing protein [Oscillospiraceae bacterium]|nr:thioredoxin domain-containing protein [Oscillospiraceae bacterium]
MKTKSRTNALINETSPYLLQHAHNPVDWYPWGKAAFEKAKNENKPIFLSIGYSTCHWCHVMAEESFEDREVGDYLNKYFVSIKVDREERPDIDSVYMNVCQAMTGRGGWPLTIIMTPDQKPFFAGTYFPKHPSFGHPGLLKLLETVVEKWKSSPHRLISDSEYITETLTDSTKHDKTMQQPGALPISKAARYFERAFDSDYGGFGSAPKFPTPHNLMFLLRLYQIKNDKKALLMVEKTLAQMYRGGIFDHVGFGFSRYSTDSKWLVPHFEKMLYDNALLTTIYLETYAVTNNPLYKTVAEKTLTYIKREMTSPEGGFYCAQDADSEGEEGKFYTFTENEIKAVLGDVDGERLCRWFSVTRRGNFEGKNILNLIDNPEYSKNDEKTEQMLSKLREYRDKRTVLHKDDKMLTAWNTLMIVAYAKAFRILGQQHYLNSAVAALEFINTNLTDKNGELYISFRDGKAQGSGLLDDYVFLAWAHLELYESTYDVKYLSRCESLSKKVLSRFADKDGGFYMNASDGEQLIIRPKEQYDGAMPSGNSVFAYCLIKLAYLTGQVFWQQQADLQLSFYYSRFEEQPYAYCFALIALMLSGFPTKEVVCVVNGDMVKKTIEVIKRGFYPQTSFLVKTPANAEELEKLAPFTKNYMLQQEKTSAFYICENKSCSAPVNSLEEMLSSLK